MEIQKKQKFLINTAYLAVILAIAYLAFKYLIGLIMPFLLALLITSMLRPAVNILVDKLRLRRAIASVVCVFLFFGVIGGLVAFLTFRFISTLADLFSILPELYTRSLEPGLQNLFSTVKEFASRLDPSLMQALGDLGPRIIKAVEDAISGVSGSALVMVSTSATSLPNIFVSGVIAVIATFFMSLDYERMSSFLSGLLPDSSRGVFIEIKNNIMRIIGRYGKSYSIILGITFSELMVGFLILGVDKAPLVALLIAVFDIFPVLGTGMILGPWAVIALIQGQYIRSVGLIIIYAVITIVRQVVEPRIVGRHVGLHPIVTLMCLFIGAKLFGVVGFFCLPLTAAILQELAEAKMINLVFWKKNDTQ